MATRVRERQSTGEWIRDAVDVVAIAAVLLAIALFALSG
jgi:hypothetical protein